MTEALLQRTAFSTSRMLEFFSEKELTMQIGHDRAFWPIALIKELIDNALDACESAGIAPEIRVTVEEDAVSVQDNGPGLPYSVLERSLDYSIRVSDKAHYVSPTRGQLGNALKCVWAAPFVENGERGCIEVHTGGVAYYIEVSLDRIAQEPRIQVTSDHSVVKNGTSVKMHWPQVASLLNRWHTRFYNVNASVLLRTYVAFNPHATFHFTSTDESWVVNATAHDWSKWTPSTPTTPHWYDADRLSGLIAAYITADPSKTVREFVAEFRGLSGTAKQKQVTEEAGLSGRILADLVENGEVSRRVVNALLLAMQNAARPVSADQLGVIGETALVARILPYVATESIRYHKVIGESDTLPYVLEVAFGIHTEDFADAGFDTCCGLNWTPAIKQPFSQLTDILSAVLLDPYSPAQLTIHLACPRLEFTDRGKSTLALPQEIHDSLVKSIDKVTSNWQQKAKQLRRAERMQERELDELRKARKRQQLSVKEAAYRVMEEAYLHASSGGRYPANARQVMYAARPLVQQLTGGVLWKNSNQFTQKYLPGFLERYPAETANWDVVYDARGHFVEPHTRNSVDLGTLGVRQYIAQWQGDAGAIELPEYRMGYPTSGPQNRFKYALFIEKEGFNQLLQAAGIASRYDIAIMSTKGMSVTAARHLVESLTEMGVTILVVRDFDKSGFSIAYTISHSTRRFRYRLKPNVIDLGLRLVHVKLMNLPSETQQFQTAKDPRILLSRYGATSDELNFMVRYQHHRKLWSGERVELNAMTSDQFIQWLEGEFARIGVRKVVPNDVILADAYRRAALLQAVEKAAQEAYRRFDPTVVQLPHNLRQRIESQLSSNPAISWDMALTQVIESEE
jgi:DNA topoisomerase VI subunit B